MTLENNVGYYIAGFGGGGYHGPGISVRLAYGKPVVDEFEPMETVRPIEKAFDLARHNDPQKQIHIYIARYDLANIRWGSNKNAVPVPATLALNRVFDIDFLEWQRDAERYRRENSEAFKAGVERAGLNWEDAKKLMAEDDEKGTDRYHTEFYLEVVRHVDEIPKPVLVKVEGIDDILDSIEVTPLPER